MASKMYTKKMDDWLKHNSLGQSRALIAEKFNKKFKSNLTDKQIGSRLSNLKIKTGAQKGTIRPSFYTKDKIDFLKKTYQKYSAKETAKLFNKKFNANKTSDQIKGTMSRLKITCGRNTTFQKGNKSWNKGKTGFMGANKTSFKKGQLPANVKPMYFERISKDGYIEIKVPMEDPNTKAKTRFILKHLWVWKKSGGIWPIPRSKCLKFINGDRKDCRIKNLKLIDLSLNLKLSKRGYDKSPDDVKPLIMAVSKLDNKADKLKRGQVKNNEAAKQ